MSNRIEGPGNQPGSALSPTPFSNENPLGSPSGPGRYGYGGETGTPAERTGAAPGGGNGRYGRDGETGTEPGGQPAGGNCEARPVKHRLTAHEQAWHPDPAHARADWVQAHEAQRNQPLDVDSNGIHKVKYGETLSDIARRYLVTQGKTPSKEEVKAEVRTLVGSNIDAYPGLAQNPDLVQPGWEIRMVPCGQVAQLPEAPPPREPPPPPHRGRPQPPPQEGPPTPVPGRETQMAPPVVGSASPEGYPWEGYPPPGAPYGAPGYGPPYMGAMVGPPMVPRMGAVVRLGPFSIGIGNGGFVGGGFMGGRHHWMEEQRERQMWQWQEQQRERQMWQWQQQQQQIYGGVPYGSTYGIPYDYSSDPSMYSGGFVPYQTAPRMMMGYYRRHRW